MFPHLPSPVSFREDINGLRAWAVIAVLLFHFSLIGLPGGFAGVDVFFVISGYLMTAIIVGGYEKGNFSVWKFYMARARRILPALMVVIATLLALGWFWLPTFDYIVLANQALSALFFVSNIFYGLEGSYFGGKDKWLLHAWSLSVEAQFYLLYPLFVALIWRFWKGLKALTLALLVLFALSLALNLVVTFWKSTLAFYLLPMRGWELVLGGLVYLIARLGWVSDALKAKGFWLGWLLVLGSFVFINNSLAWPGYWAILPVVGAGLIILAQKESCWLTNNAVAQWLGDRSYSLYLWHWPLVVALYFAGLQSDWAWVLGFFALSLLLAHLSYRFVEVPTRSYLTASSRSKEVKLIFITGLFFIFYALLVKNALPDNRIDPIVNLIASEAGNYNPKREACQPDINGLNSPGCVFGDSNVGAYLIGDSHSDMVATAFGESASKFGLGIKLFSRMGCPTIEDVEIRLSSRSACTNFNRWLFEFLEKDTSGLPVVVVNDIWHQNDHKPKVSFGDVTDNTYTKLEDVFSNKSVSTICKIATKRPVWLVRPIPTAMSDVPKQISRDLLLGRLKKEELQDAKFSMENYHARSSFIWSVQDKILRECGVKILDPLPYLCDDQYCYGSRNGRPLYYDAGHLSEYGNKFLVPMFEQVFQAGQ